MTLASELIVIMTLASELIVTKGPPGEKPDDLLLGPARLDELDQGELRAKRISVGRGVGADDNAARALKKRGDLVKAFALTSVVNLTQHDGLPYSSSFSAGSSCGSTG